MQKLQVVYFKNALNRGPFVSLSKTTKKAALGECIVCYILYLSITFVCIVLICTCNQTLYLHR